MLRRLPASFAFLALVLICGCGRGDAEVAVPHVEIAEQPQVSQTEESLDWIQRQEPCWEKRK